MGDDRGSRGEGTGAMIVTRFAPSPTGQLHLGHAYSAIQAHDFARNRGGRFLLRIEDIDGTRSRREHVASILADLSWLGLHWDEEPVFQSMRLERYAKALAGLRARGLIYPCFCTRADISAHLGAPHGREAVYPGTCRVLSGAAQERRVQTEAHAWRLDAMRVVQMIASPLTWHDELAGTQTVDPRSVGDVVLARKDAPASYHLAVTIDDAAEGISHVVRGVDLFAATHVHRLLQALLDLPTPEYRHHPLLTDANGNRLAKRHGAPALAALRLAGEDGHALADRLRAGTLPVGFAAANA
jgi:glutamyl-Q tRNA(Asp) synthetase